MKIEDFIEKFAEAIEIENVEKLTPGTEFHELEEWSSISVMLLIAFFDEEFGVELIPAKIREANTISDLYKIATE